MALAASWATQVQTLSRFRGRGFRFLVVGPDGNYSLVMHVNGLGLLRPHRQDLDHSDTFSFRLVHSCWYLLPVSGFILEQIGSYTQTDEWRKQLVEKEILPEFPRSDLAERNEERI